MIELTIAVLVVLLVSATCSLFEAVLYSVPISHIESLVQAKKSTGKILQKLRENVDAPIAAILSLNTIANTAGATVAGAIAANVLGSEWLWTFSAGFTLAILFFSEVIPKTFGVVYARPISSWIARPLKLLVWLFTPLTWLLGLVTKLIADNRASEQISGTELVVMTHLGVRLGTIREDEGTVIENILSLEKKTVHEVMTPRTVLFSFPGSMTVAEARKDKGLFFHSRIPVYGKDFDDVIGIIHRQDVLFAVTEEQLEIKIEMLMKPVHFVLESTPLDKVLKMFLERHQHMFVVIDEFGGLSGVITLEDVLEEILGQEIVDESDRVTDMRELAERRREQLLKQYERYDISRQGNE